MKTGLGTRLGCIGLAVLLPTLAGAQQDHSGHGSGDQNSMAMQQDDMEGGKCRMMQQQSAESAAATDVQGATVFATIQRLVKQLQADPDTDWGAVDIAALRQHLVDMEILSLYAEVNIQPLEKGAVFSVSGEGRTLQAIQRMVPTHADQIQSELGWQVSAQLVDSGVSLRVESAGPDAAAMIQALGFIGFMTLGDHHQLHHLGMAGPSDHEPAGAMDHSQHGTGGHQGH